MTVARLLVVWLIAAIAVAGCTVAVRLQERGITIEWPSLPDLGIPNIMKGGE